MLFFKSSKPAQQFDPEFYQPVIRSSICTGEKTAGFKDKRDGRFIELCVLRTDGDKKEFLRRYGLEEAQVRVEY